MNYFGMLKIVENVKPKIHVSRQHKSALKEEFTLILCYLHWFMGLSFSIKALIIWQEKIEEMKYLNT